MYEKSRGMLPSVTAFALYILGGLFLFGGIALIALMGGRDLLGWGSAKTIGYLLICVGASFSILGVLVLRLVRNRTDCLLSESARRPVKP